MKRVLTMLALLACALPSPSAVLLTDCSEESLRTLVANGGTFTLQCTNPITLTRPLVITRNTTIIATNKAALTGASKSRLIVVHPGVSLTLSNVGLFSGRHTSTNFNDGGIPDTAGAAIFNDGGTVNFFNAQIDGNAVVGTPGAAGADGATGKDGEDGGDGAGGAIYNRAGLVLLSNCVLNANSATGGVAGRGGNATAGVLGNGGDGGRGGSGGGAAIFSQAGTLLIYNSTFTNNQATGAQGGIAGTQMGLGFRGHIGESGAALGGAIATAGAYAVVNGCTFVNNSVKGPDGLVGVAGIRNQEGDTGGEGGDAAGGAISNGGSLLMTNCTLVGNSTLGGKGGLGGAGSPDSLGTDGGNGGNGGDAVGGAIENAGSLKLINCTFSNNKATPGEPALGGAGGGTFGDAGDPGSLGQVFAGGIYNRGPEFSLANTIVSQSAGGNFYGNHTDLGGNISSDPTALFVSGGSRVNLDPLLQALANNGGPTFTMAIDTNSPAYNAALALYSPPTDQRGTNRVHPFDIGAFEFRQTLPPATNGTTSLTNALPLFISTNTSSNITLRWLATTNHILQSSTNLLTNGWTKVTQTPTLYRGYYNLQLSIPTNTPVRFFRVFTLAGTTSTNTIVLPPTPQ